MYPLYENDYGGAFDNSNIEFDNFEGSSVREDDQLQAQQNVLWILTLYSLKQEEDMKVARNLIEAHSRAEGAKKRQVIRRRKRRAETRKFYTDPITRDLRPMTPKLSSWWIWYIQCPKPDSKQWVKTFRSRFRLRHSSFVHVLKLLCDDRSGLFDRWKQQGQADGMDVLPLLMEGES